MGCSTNNIRIMNARAFYNLVKEMRENQRNYLQTKQNRFLSRAKQLERQVDAEITRVERVLSGEKSLFDNP